MMAKSLRHFFLLSAAITMIVACDDRAIPSDQLGTDGIQQGKIAYDTITNLREVNEIDTISIDHAWEIGLAGGSSEKYYVIGAVRGFYKQLGEDTKDETTKKTISPYMSNKLGNRVMTCYRLTTLNGKGFSDAAQIKDGDIIVVYGKIESFKGKPQISDSPKLINSDNPESGIKKTLLSESFNDGVGSFEIVDKKAATEAVWQHKPAAGSAQGYMLATAKINDAIQEAESWLISPAINLTACKDGAVLTFSHYYIGTEEERDQLLKVMVSTDGGSTWNQLSVGDNWNNGKLKRFADATISLKDYSSTNAKIAFAYKSTATTAMQWAVQNVKVGDPEDEPAAE